MKAKGSELKAFYADWPLGDDWYVDDGMYNDEGDLDVEHEEEYLVEDALGMFIWQGKGNVPSSIQINGTRVRVPQDWMGPSTDAVFRAWRGDAVVVSVRLQPESRKELQKICTERGWTFLE